MTSVDVIYIEDDETEALLFRYGLAPRGIQVLHLPDASPASLVSLQNPDYQRAAAIFCDLWISGANGVEVGRALRAAGDERPFFLLTAGENPNPALLRELNITYLRKPVDFGETAATILSLAGA